MMKLHLKIPFLLLFTCCLLVPTAVDGADIRGSASSSSSQQQTVSSSSVVAAAVEEEQDDRARQRRTLAAVADAEDPDVSNNNTSTNDNSTMIFSTGYIVGGTAATGSDVPWFVHFGDGSCGASLISPNRVLTAAHCVFGRGAPATVRVGATTQSDGTTVGVRCANIHPDYDGFVSNDLAILKLESSVDADTITPIAFNADGNNPAASGQALTVIGLGLTSTSGSVSNVLLKIDQTTVSTSNCDNDYGGGGNVQQAQHLCAIATSKGSCNGDSGGPIFDSSKVQVGIVSFGSSQGCASGIPDGYTRVSTYSNWITEQLTDESCTGCSIWPWDWCSQVRDAVVAFAKGMFGGEK